MINLSNINSLLELFIKKYEEQSDKNSILLSSLSKPLNDYSWEKTINSIYNLSEEINKLYKIKEMGRMAELVDALDSKSNSSNTVRVRFSLCPPTF